MALILELLTSPYFFLAGYYTSFPRQSQSASRQLRGDGYTCGEAGGLDAGVGGAGIASLCLRAVWNGSSQRRAERSDEQQRAPAEERRQAQQRSAQGRANDVAQAVRR